MCEGVFDFVRVCSTLFFWGGGGSAGCGLLVGLRKTQNTNQPAKGSFCDSCMHVPLSLTKGFVVCVCVCLAAR